MSDFPDHRQIRQAVLLLFLLPVLGGCGIARTTDSDPAGSDSGSRQRSATSWVPLVSPRTPPTAAWPLADGASTPPQAGQSEGLALVIRELDAVARLVDRVRQMPPDPGRHVIRFTRIQADLQAVRSGLVEAILQPHTRPRNYPALHGQYGD